MAGSVENQNPTQTQPTVPYCQALSIILRTCTTLVYYKTFYIYYVNIFIDLFIDLFI